MGSSIFMSETVIEFGWSVRDTDLLYFLWNGGNTTREHSPLDRITHRFSSGLFRKHWKMYGKASKILLIQVQQLLMHFVASATGVCALLVISSFSPRVYK